MGITLNVTIYKASDYRYCETKTVAESNFFAFIQRLNAKYNKELIINTEGSKVEITIYDDYLE